MHLIRTGTNKVFNIDLTHSIEFEHLQGGTQARIYLTSSRP